MFGLPTTATGVQFRTIRRNGKLRVIPMPER